MSKEQLIRREAEKCVRSHLRAWKELYLTIKGHTLIANAGIDESNGNGYYILWHERPSELAREIRSYLCKHFKLNNLAVILTDSHITPLERECLEFQSAFSALSRFMIIVERPTSLGRVLKHTSKNIVDAISTMAVLLMGEGRERTPMIILRNAEFIQYTDKKSHRRSVVLPRDDFYAPLWRVFY